MRTKKGTSFFAKTKIRKKILSLNRDLMPRCWWRYFTPHRGDCHQNKRNHLCFSFGFFLFVTHNVISISGVNATRKKTETKNEKNNKAYISFWSLCGFCLIRNDKDLRRKKRIKNLYISHFGVCSAIRQREKEHCTPTITAATKHNGIHTTDNAVMMMMMM